MTDDVAQAGEGHLKCAGDGRGGHGDDVDFELQLAQQLLLLDAEALLLIDDQQAEILGANVAGENAVGADEDVGAPFGESLDGGFLLGGGAKAGDVVDREGVVGEPLREGPVVLLGEDRGGNEHEHLLAVVGGLEGGPQGDLRLAIADIAADQAVHRAGRLHVGLRELDGIALVGGLRVGEARLELALPVGVRRKGVPGAPPALGVEAEQLAGHLLGGAPRARLHRLPARASEL